MIQPSISLVPQPLPQLPALTNLETLKVQMLAANTITELHALIVDYTDVEIKQVYSRLTPVQQSRIDAICEQNWKG